MDDIRLRLKRFSIQLLIGLLVSFQLMLLVPHVAQATSTTLVISEVQFGGATAADEFVELYNLTAAPIDLSVVGAELHIRNGAGTDANKPLTFGSSVVPAKGYFLIVNASAPASLLSLADATYSGSGNTLVSGGAVSLSTVATSDLVGWNGQPVGGFEGTVFTSTPTFAAGMSIERLPGGINGNAQDTDDNAADFRLLATPTPQNSGSGITPTAPAAPVLSPVVAGDGEVTLTWSTVADVKDYIVYQDGLALVAPVVAPTTTKVVTGLTNGTTYAFTISARNLSDMEGVASNSQSGTPQAAIVVTPTAVPVSVAYYASGSVAAATRFGVTNVRAEVTTQPATALVAADNPALVFSRPNSAPVTIALTFDAVNGVWKTVSDYAVVLSNGTQDGSVSVALTTTTGKTVSFVAGDSFVADTTVNAPVVSVNSRCSANQDSFSATVDTDVIQVLIYKDLPTTDMNNLIAVAPASNGRIDEVFIGDNAFSALYLVAIDTLGNRSAITTVMNDTAAPVVPRLQLESGNGVIIATWAAVDGAQSYLVRWRATDTANGQQQVVTGTRVELAVTNGKTYEVTVASQDAACNLSAFAGLNATPSLLRASDARGGVAARENALFAQSLMIADTKDGEATPHKSPFSLEEDKDQNGVKDAEEDRNQNGIKDGEESTVTPSPTPSDSAPQVKDRSRLIITIAVLLILAGAALAAYSWYRGDDAATPESTPVEPEPTEPKPTEPKAESKKGAAEEAKPAADKKATEEAASPAAASKPKKGGGKKRKTRW